MTRVRVECSMLAMFVFVHLELDAHLLGKTALSLSLRPGAKSDLSQRRHNRKCTYRRPRKHQHIFDEDREREKICTFFLADPPSYLAGKEPTSTSNKSGVLSLNLEYLSLKARVWLGRPRVLGRTGLVFAWGAKGPGPGRLGS